MVRMGFFSGSANRDQRSGGSGEEDTAFLNKFIRKADEKFIKQYESKQEGGIENSDFETQKYKKLKEKYKDEFSFSPRGKEVATLASLDPTQNIQPQSLSPIGSPAYEKELEGFKKEMKDTYNYRTTYDLDTGEEIDKYFQKVPGGRVYGDVEMERDYPIFRQFRYERNPLNYQQGVPFGKTEEKGNALQRIAGSIFNAVTGTPPAAAQPIMSTLSDAADTSFRAYRMGEDFSNLIRGVGDLPAQDTSFSSYVRGAQPGQERGNTRLQEARNIARRNPNVSINEKTGRAEATNNSGRARAQAMAVNRKLSGKSISQKKAENKQAMKDRAKARHAAFKKKRAEKKKKMKNKKKK